MIRRFYPEPKSGPPKPRFTAGRDPDFLAWIRRQPCCITGKRSGDFVTVTFPSGKTGSVRAIIEASHVRSRGASGVDKGNTVPMELSVHRDYHRMGRKSFAAKHGVDLAEVAQELAAEYDERGAGFR